MRSRRVSGRRARPARFLPQDSAAGELTDVCTRAYARAELLEGSAGEHPDARVAPGARGSTTLTIPAAQAQLTIVGQLRGSQAQVPTRPRYVAAPRSARGSEHPCRIPLSHGMRVPLPPRGPPRAARVGARPDVSRRDGGTPRASSSSGCSRAGSTPSHRGRHQFHRPSSVIDAGTSTVRISVASSSSARRRRSPSAGT